MLQKVGAVCSIVSLATLLIGWISKTGWLRYLFFGIAIVAGVLFVIALAVWVVKKLRIESHKMKLRSIFEEFADGFGDRKTHSIIKIIDDTISMAKHQKDQEAQEHLSVPLERAKVLKGCFNYFKNTIGRINDIEMLFGEAQSILGLTGKSYCDLWGAIQHNADIITELRKSKDVANFKVLYNDAVRDFNRLSSKASQYPRNLDALPEY